MTDLEHVLRDALDARAGAVAADPLAYGRVVRRRDRRRLRRRVTLTALTAATAALVAVASWPGAGRRAAEPARPAEPGPLPQWVGAVTEAEFRIYRGFDFTAADSSTDPTGEDVTAVTAGSRAGRFYWAISPEPGSSRCQSRIVRHDFLPGDEGSSDRLVAGRNPVAGQVVALAASPAGQRLAYFVRLPASDGTCGSDGELRVRDLRDGTDRVWRPASHAARVAEVTSLSWDPDGFRLSLGAGFEVLDTTAPGDTFTTDAFDRVDVDGRLCEVRDKTYHPRSGNLVAWVRCIVPFQAGNGVYEYGADGKALRRLFEVPLTFADSRPQLDFDSSGDHLLIRVDDLANIAPLRWNAREGLVAGKPRLEPTTRYLVW